jgi:inward rectifier potassium channel
MADMSRPSGTALLVRRAGSPRLELVGRRRRPFADAYHFLLRARWSVVIALIAAVYAATNLAFTAVYLALGAGAIENARPGSFADAFFFSVQTLATIGYGKMLPGSTAANLVVCAEALAGILLVAMATGLLFSKFSRPTARVIFSNRAVIAPFEGRRALMFRMGNERGNQIGEAALHVTLVRSERTREGLQLRRMIDLPMVRSQSIVFSLTWTAIHFIDEHSPLHGQTPDSLADAEVEIVISLTGTDDTFSQTITARHSYTPDEIIFDARFADIISRRPDGARRVDFTHFHDVTPAA